MLSSLHCSIFQGTGTLQYIPGHRNIAVYSRAQEHSSIFRGTGIFQFIPGNRNADSVKKVEVIQLLSNQVGFHTDRIQRRDPAWAYTYSTIIIGDISPFWGFFFGGKNDEVTVL